MRTPDGANGPGRDIDSGAPSIEVCIVSFNSAVELSVTLDAVATHIPDAVVAIREHGSDPTSLRALRQLIATSKLSVRLDIDAGNPGFAAGCNALAARSQAPWLLFLNPDAEVLAWPWSASRLPPNAQVTGPFMVGDGESERQSGVSFRIRDEIGRSWLRRRGPAPVGRGFVSGAAFLIDRASFSVLGGFDPSYFMYYEDIDLCFRANDADLDTRIEPEWRVHHPGAHATSAVFGESVQWSYRSACRFHHGRGSNLAAYRAYVTLDSIFRAVLHMVRRDRRALSAYLRLARTALRDLATRRPPH